MTRETFETLSLILGSDLDTPQVNVPVVKKLAIAIWTFSNQEVYRSIADRFGVAKSTAWQCMLDVATALCARSKEYIQWPREEVALENEYKFRQICGFPGIIGVVDGCYIQISAPSENPESYVNRHGYYSINFQGICDAEMRFIDVFAGCCGSMNDARVWQLSDIHQESVLHSDDYFPNQCHILGDKAYKLNFNMLTPYKNFGNMPRVQVFYNLLHARTRQIIERAFALLVCRFRRLKYLYLQNVLYASLIILTCCILHNICISFNDIIEDYEIVHDNDNCEVQFDNDDSIVEVPQRNENRFHPEIKRNIVDNELFANQRI
ncbi:putative nuclease HARBI1 [Leptopilina heterotoma]|uniref:putative nuclease HARBI1 n=1 Tax=Leptopilina heterotoma TaxID=63436 RepID=UPI001CA7BD80|nr:putative nuclease HARBI1 [Leptopilina heterotoma]XP_043485210.1 putative nuclease HARBI1 [Leptopilina heterotoma]